MSTNLEGRIDIRLGRDGEAGMRVEIRSSRPFLAQKLMAGRAPEAAADMAGLIFSLCGQAQRVASLAACEAARGLSPASEVLQTRAREVLVELGQEHAWRLLLNWPEQAGRAPDMPSLLRLRQASGDTDAFAHALEDVLAASALGGPASGWQAGDAAAFAAWRDAGATLVAKLFADLGDAADMGISHTTLLPPLAELDEADVRNLAGLALESPTFCASPIWRGAPAETGSLARTRNHPLMVDWVARRGRGAGARLLARLLELADLPDRLRRRDPDLARRVVRAWALGENTGVAGVETSRGLLFHVVRLEAGKVADYRIVAPTEWNFHPAGPLAQALADLVPGPGLEVRARLVSQSLDPCVAYGVELIDA